MGFTAFFNEPEQRIRRLYELLQIGVKPWEWDYDNYSGKNKSMKGYFYLEDLENIKQIDYYERNRKK